MTCSNDRLGSFNPRAHVGRDLAHAQLIHDLTVSIHAPTWGATCRAQLHQRALLFQSTRPRGARLEGGVQHGVSQLFQSTRPRGARRMRFYVSDAHFKVSIHAPTWGATVPVVAYHKRALFQSTRPRGARQGVVAQLNALSMFQSTRPRGARLMCSFSFYVQIVSIHAPTWGATFYRSQALADSMFQSTRPRGARHVLSITLKFLICFNPRAHVGRDRRDLPWRHATCGFNPRAHVGRDQATQVVNRNILFQSTRPRGARLGGKSNPINISVSIHAPTWGATRAC